MNTTLPKESPRRVTSTQRKGVAASTVNAASEQTTRTESLGHASKARRVSPGSPWPLGVRWIEAEQAFNFAFFSRHATGVTLLCYDEKNPAKPVFDFRFK